MTWKAIFYDLCLTNFDPEISLKYISEASNVGIAIILLYVYTDDVAKKISFDSIFK